MVNAKRIMNNGKWCYFWWWTDSGTEELNNESTQRLRNTCAPWILLAQHKHRSSPPARSCEMEGVGGMVELTPSLSCIYCVGWRFRALKFTCLTSWQIGMKSLVFHCTDWIMWIAIGDGFIKTFMFIGYSKIWKDVMFPFIIDIFTKEVCLSVCLCFTVN